jgi:large subunit ribosomal protein L23
MDNINVIIKPLVTEKSTHLQQTRNSYAFQVQRAREQGADPPAVEKLYDVKVTDVRTMVRKGKPRRSRFKVTTTPSWKRAIVTLEENSRIELF